MSNGEDAPVSSPARSVLAYPARLPEAVREAAGRLDIALVPVAGEDAVSPREPITGAIVSFADIPQRALRFLEVLSGGTGGTGGAGGTGGTGHEGVASRAGAGSHAAIGGGAHAARPVLAVVSASQLHWIGAAKGLFSDWCLAEARAEELEMRLQIAFRITEVAGTPEDRLSYGPVAIDPASYRVTVAGETLDLTFMEYKLLAFLVANPERVFTRDALLSRVWGYDYYGGPRTVDVHIRRLRSKLGDRHANLIDTVRSVGYILRAR